MNTRTRHSLNYQHHSVDFTEVQTLVSGYKEHNLHISKSRYRMHVRARYLTVTYFDLFTLSTTCFLSKATRVRTCQLTGGRKGETRQRDGGFAVTLKIQSENSVICETAARADSSKD